MKSGKLLGIIIQVIATTLTFSQTYIPPGDVSGTWFLNDSPFYIQGDITIPNDSTLIIEPGVLVEFKGHYALNVQGRLLSIGNESSSITFTRDDTTGFHNPDITQGGWNGIQFIDTPTENDTSKIIYCILQYGKAVGSSPPDNSGGALFISNFDKVLISNSLITYNSSGGTDSPSGGAISLHFADITLTDNEISFNKAFDGGGIQIWECNPVFNNNSVIFNSADQTGGGFWIGGISNVVFNNDIISNNYAEGNGGGLICWQTTNTTFSSVNIVNNTAYDGGGAAFYDCDVQFNNCDISDNASAWIGGGLNAYSCNLEVNNTSFERDTAFVFGGAMGIYFSNLTINNSNLTDNSARILGGGVHSDGSNINILNTTFHRDTTSESGGAIFNWLCQAQIIGCDFIENSASNGGAISSSNSDLFIDSSLFLQNLSKNQGAALEYIADTSNFISTVQLKISNSKFEENLSLVRCGVALIEQYNSNDPLANVIIDNCEFISNDALRVGAIRMGSIKDFILSNTKFIGNVVDLYTACCTFASFSSGNVYNCLFADNIANGGSSGGAGVSIFSNVNFMNCTFVKNRSGSGGAIQLRAGGQVTLANSILWGNLPDQISLNAVNDTSACILHSNYNDIQFGIDSVHITDSISVVNWGFGNIDDDPLFVDTLNNDFHLQDFSPCIAAGIDSIEIGGFWYYCPLKDIEGNPRPNPAGTMPDMGAYESVYPSGMIENNSIILIDYYLFQNYPNPFNPTTTIRWQLPETGFVTLKIYDVLGNEVANIVNEEKPAGEHEVQFEGIGLSSGVYFYRLQAGSLIQTKKMVFMK